MCYINANLLLFTPSVLEDALLDTPANFVIAVHWTRLDRFAMKRCAKTVPAIPGTVDLAGFCRFAGTRITKGVAARARTVQRAPHGSLIVVRVTDAVAANAPAVLGTRGGRFAEIRVAQAIAANTGTVHRTEKRMLA